MHVEPDPPVEPDLIEERPNAPHPRPTTVRGILAKLSIIAVINALALYGLLATYAQGLWGMFTFLAVTAVVANVIYFSNRFIPGKYLFPGVFFLAVFQIFVVLYTGYVSLTNYGDGRQLDQDEALERVLALSERRLPDTPSYPLTIVADGDDLAMLVTGEDGTAMLGTEEGLETLDPDVATFDGAGRAIEVEGYRRLTLGDLGPIQNEVLALRVPLSDEPDSGSLRTDDGSRAYVARSPYVYDEVADTITDMDTGTVFADNGFGAYESPEGRQLIPGWRVWVGADNYVRFLQEPRIRAPLVQVFLWTFSFAVLSALGTFALGLALAMLFNHEGMRGRKVYRSLLLLPYAVPSFLTILVWAGMLNTSFGFVNQVLLGGADIAWLNDPWLARFSVVFVNLWLGFPYMFLICTGALQSIPAETLEAAHIDGAGPFQTTRRIVLPLILVSTAPLIIASFAFNFNNFTVIFWLTRGGPTIPDAPITVGSTDLLITLVYRLSFGTGGNEWGFAAAISVVIFVVVASISAISFKRTRALEDLN